MINRLLLPILLLLPIHANAECPEIVSKGEQLTLSRNSPAFEEHYVVKNNGFLKTVKYQRGNSDYTNTQRLINGLIITERASKDHVFNVIYKNDFSGIEQLPQNKTWSSEIDVFKDGLLFKSGKDILQYIESKNIAIGQCSYEIWELLSTSSFDKGRTVYFKKYYSPKLKLVLRTIRLDSNQNPLNQVIFDQIKMEEILE